MSDRPETNAVKKVAADLSEATSRLAQMAIEAELAIHRATNVTGIGLYSTFGYMIDNQQKILQAQISKADASLTLDGAIAWQVQISSVLGRFAKNILAHPCLDRSFCDPLGSLIEALDKQMAEVEKVVEEREPCQCFRCTLKRKLFGGKPANGEMPEMPLSELEQSLEQAIKDGLSQLPAGMMSAIIVDGDSAETCEPDEIARKLAKRLAAGMK